MINLTKLICGGEFDSDYLRYNKDLSHIAPVVVWNSTRACNLHCKHCYIEAQALPEKEELSTAQAKKFIDDLADFKVKVMLFSGGEPVLRKDIFSLSRYANRKNIRTALSTNGTLITPQVAQKIKEAGFSYVGVSLDGKPRTHDKFRDKKGAFKMAFLGIKNCQKLNIKVGIRFTLTKQNVEDIPFIFKLLEKEDISRICFYHLVYTGRASKLKDKKLSFREVRKAIDIICKKTKELFSKDAAKEKKYEVLTVDNYTDGPYLYLKSLKEESTRANEIIKLLKTNKQNPSRLGVVCVNYLGEVYPDQFWKGPSLGNVQHRKFSDILLDKSNRLILNLQNTKSLIKGRCSYCNFFEICNGNLTSRAKVLKDNILKDDIWAEYPSCYLTNKEIRDGENEFSRN